VRYCKTILVIEDDPGDQELILEAFRSNGINTTIHVLNNGNEAIAYLMGEGQYADREKFGYPTFIMTDLQMPVADGFAVLQQPKSNPEWAIIPTVVLTSSADPDDIKKSYMLGAGCYHQKPQSMAELRNLIKILHDYWMTCEVPEVDVTGRQVATQSKGKLGQRFPQPSGGEQRRS